MASKRRKRMSFPNKVAALKLGKLLRGEVQDGDQAATTLGQLMAARAFVELGVVAFGNRDLRRLGKHADEREGVTVGSEKVTLWLSPSKNGSAVFEFFGFNTDSALFYVTPEDFDVSREEERGKFEAYRALIDMARKLRSTMKNEGARKLGPFNVQCHTKKDKPKWKKVWQRWVNAHNE